MDLGAWLMEYRSRLDRAEALWLERLAQFDREGLWALDGQLSCANWLVWRTGMARSTAFEKLRVAHELQRRPVVAEAFRAGRLSYSITRALTRMDRPDPSLDQTVVDAASAGELGVTDVEMLARTYRLYSDQDRPPPDEDVTRRRDVRIARGEDGHGQVVITLTDTELEEFAATLRAFTDLRYRGDGPVDESSAEDCIAGEEAPLEQPSPGEIRTGAFMDMVRTALEHADHGHAAGDDRYLVHLVRTAGSPMTFLDGRPVRPADAAAITCDSSTVAHTVGAEGEALSLGRKTREWSTAQRRAISVRDGGRCRFVGCPNRLYDLHHLEPWEAGGPTDIDNGCCQCRRHHRMLHQGYRVEGSPDHEMRFYRPDGTYIGSSFPAIARMVAPSG